MPKRKVRYAIVGVGGRSRMYVKALAERYRGIAELVAACDTNQGRLDLLNRDLAAWDHPAVPLYLDRAFDRMVAETRPDKVIVTTKDCWHHQYIVRAMELGCDAVTEKPMTTDEAKCRRIGETMRRTGRRLRVTFNYRYAPSRTQIKDLLMAGAIGKVLSVDFHWLLDTRHGADYFRRWHRFKKDSGTLLVHKATHHFDLVNWWLSAAPVEVLARGGRAFYTPRTADRYGLRRRTDRCLTCPEKARCKFYLDLAANPRLKEMYLDNEKYDGYRRDRCVFGRDITIYDTMTLVATYDSGAFLAFSLTAFCPKEGYEVRFNGTRGRLEFTTLEAAYISGADAPEKQHATIQKATRLTVWPHFAPGYEVEVWRGTGGHGGGDDPLLDSVFLPRPPKDKYKRSAGYAEGAYSILTGIAARKSIETGRPVRIARLVPGLPPPDFPKMPAW
jgi:predicted dehydrogenase